MKATGIVRKIDELGRIVLPVELRRTLNIDIKDPVEIFTENDCIILRKYEPVLGLSNDIENMISKIVSSTNCMNKADRETAEAAIKALQELAGISEE